MKHLNLTVQIDPQFSADEWCLYDNSELVALGLNDALRDAVNMPLSTKSSVRSVMFRVMKQYASAGAFDSEPIYFLENVLEVVYKS